MNLSALSISRPVMVVLLSLSLIVAGVMAYMQIPVAALPSYNTPVINVNADLPGASPETMASSVALPLEKQFSTIGGLNLITSSSTLGQTSLTLEFDPSIDVNAAAVDVQAALLRAQRSLPAEMTDLPSYRKVNPADAPILFMAMNSPSMSLPEITDFAENLIGPSLSSINGVAQVLVFGAKRYAVRVRVKPDLLAARNLSLDEVAQAIRNANPNSPLGVLEGPQQILTIQASGALMKAADFAPLVIAQRNGQPVRLSEIATVEDSNLGIRAYGSYRGERSVTLAVLRQPNANTVQVVDAIKKMMPRFQEQVPSSVKITLVNDRSLSIRESIHDVNLTLGLTVALVVLVIFLFLHRLTATFIPAITMPISLLGALTLLYWMGYSLDNVSLLGITLAVGLVVDDAIVVLENIVRHIELGKKPMAAALIGAQEMGFTIVSISLSLVAVFIPIFFMPGVIGLLLHEFAVVVGLSILVSAVVSLTLVPMLASRLLRANDAQHQSLRGLARWFEAFFLWMQRGYTRALDWSLAHRLFILAVACATLGGSIWLYITIPKGFFPEEDIGQIQVSTEAAEDTSSAAMQAMQDQVAALFLKNPHLVHITSFTTGGNNGRMFLVLKPKSERPKMAEVLDGLRKQARSVPGITLYFRPVQNLQIGGRPSKSRYQYTLQSVSSDALSDWANRFQEKMRADPVFRDVTSDAQQKGLQASIKIDREKAAALGVAMNDIRTALYAAHGERQVSTIYTPAASYAVIMEAVEEERQFESSLGKLTVRAKNGNLVQLSAFTTVERTVGPTVVNHQGQLPAITIAFNLAPDVPLGVATAKISKIGQEIKLPASIITKYGGDAAVFQDSQSSQMMLIIAALLVIYVMLGVLYESYIHPLTILAGLPSAALGALLTLKLFGMDLTIIATIGILMLIGIVKKNAIMMIDFALHAQREQGMAPAQAIREACILRFRPIMMTTLAAAMGALPLAFGWGAGAELRQPLGLTVVGGLLLSQVVTLFITPVIYLYLDKFSGKGPLDLSKLAQTA
ncbi:efflux RND transporter permease subunit [Massilia sp. W12]|uniref:efflux RND transporter permease subunit n=1 Tax=Massilia sp. W12 TaxID=3126507 RepID=UPI0030D0A5BA